MKKKRVSPLLRRKLLFLFSRHWDGWQVSSDTIGRSRQHEITPSFNIYTRQRPAGRDGVTEFKSCPIAVHSTATPPSLRWHAKQKLKQIIIIIIRRTAFFSVNWAGWRVSFRRWSSYHFSRWPGFTSQNKKILKGPFFLFRLLLYSHPNLNFPRWHQSLNFDHCARPGRRTPNSQQLDLTIHSTLSADHQENLNGSGVYVKFLNNKQQVGIEQNFLNASTLGHRNKGHQCSR